MPMGMPTPTCRPSSSTSPARLPNSALSRLAHNLRNVSPGATGRAASSSAFLRSGTMFAPISSGRTSFGTWPAATSFTTAARLCSVSCGSSCSAAARMCAGFRPVGPDAVPFLKWHSSRYTSTTGARVVLACPRNCVRSTGSPTGCLSRICWSTLSVTASRPRETSADAARDACPSRAKPTARRSRDSASCSGGGAPSPRCRWRVFSHTSPALPSRHSSMSSRADAILPLALPLPPRRRTRTALGSISRRRHANSSPHFATSSSAAASSSAHKPTSSRGMLSHSATLRCAISTSEGRGVAPAGSSCVRSTRLGDAASVSAR